MGICRKLDPKKGYFLGSLGECKEAKVFHKLAKQLKESRKVKPGDLELQGNEKMLAVQ